MALSEQYLYGAFFSAIALQTQKVLGVSLIYSYLQTIRHRYFGNILALLLFI